jgi:hypothetical protein
LKPDLVWLYYVKPIVETGEVSAVAQPLTPEMPEPSGGIAWPGMPGPAAPSGFGAGQQSTAADQPLNLPPQMIREIEIQGHSLVYDRFAPTATADTERAEREAGDENETGAEAAPVVAAPEVGSMPQQTPEQVLEARLAASDMFDAAGTKITNYQSSRNVLNLTTFTMRLRLSQPIVIKYE